jgi:hypothetical protein
MDPKSIHKYIQFSNTNPTEPGLYIFVRHESLENLTVNHIPVNLIEIKYINDRLVADCDSLYRNMPLDKFINLCNGKWSKRVCFEQEE